MDISEKNLEDTIEQVLLSSVKAASSDGARSAIHQPAPLYGPATSNLLQEDVAPGGYHKRRSEDYDKTLCLIPGDVLSFIYATQPKEWEKFKKQHEGDAKARFLQRLAGEIKTRGTWMCCVEALRQTAASSSLPTFIQPAV